MPLKQQAPAASPSQLASLDSTENSRSTALTFSKAAIDLPLHHCESEPDLHSLAINITERKKRKFDDENTDIMVLIKEMFVSFSREQEKRFQELKTSMDLMSNKYDDFLSKINTLETEKKADKLLIKELEEKLETMERKTRCTGIEIRNIPKHSGETKEFLCKDRSFTIGENN